MSIRLIDEREELKFTWGDSTIYYRRVPSGEFSRMQRQHTKRGVVNERGVTDAVFQYAILRWEGVTDIDGNEVPFDPSKLAKLPEEVRGEIAEELFAGDPKQAMMKGSSNGSMPGQP